MSRSIVFAKDESYHVYNRGVDKRKIFLSDHDYNRFMILLYLCNSEKDVDIAELFRQGNSFEDLFGIDRRETLVDIGLFCLMPNHFHLLVREKELNDKNGVSKFMKKVSTAYTMYFNNKYQRTGALFQGRFKAKHISTDQYLRYLYAYINLNPVKLIEPEWKEEGIKNGSRLANKC